MTECADTFYPVNDKFTTECFRNERNSEENNKMKWLRVSEWVSKILCVFVTFRRVFEHVCVEVRAVSASTTIQCCFANARLCLLTRLTVRRGYYLCIVCTIVSASVCLCVTVSLCLCLCHTNWWSVSDSIVNSCRLPKSAFILEINRFKTKPHGCEAICTIPKIVAWISSFIRTEKEEEEETEERFWFENVFAWIVFVVVVAIIRSAAAAVADACLICFVCFVFAGAQHLSVCSVCWVSRMSLFFTRMNSIASHTSYLQRI